MNLVVILLPQPPFAGLQVCLATSADLVKVLKQRPGLGWLFRKAWELGAKKMMGSENWSVRVFVDLLFEGERGRQPINIRKEEIVRRQRQANL